MYSLLRGIRVLEVALLAPDALGQHLADLGAEVIKVEEPPNGDYVRLVGYQHLGGLSLMHLRWNRGKKSVLLNPKAPEGRDVFLELARRSQVVIDGLRAGAVDRFGIGYEAVRAVNPKIVYCSLSGLGQSGPYRNLATHGLTYDAMTGLAPPVIAADGYPRIPDGTIGVGTQLAPLYAAMGVLAALVRSVQTGQGQHIDVAQADAAFAWRAGTVEAVMNGLPGGGSVSMAPAVRYQYYGTKDGRFIIFMASERKFWKKFCEAVDRMDLYETKPGAEVGEHARGDEDLRHELAKIFQTRTQREWVQLFLDENVPGGPVHENADFVHDPHFQSRGNILEQDHPQAGRVTMVSTPIKLPGETFEAGPAPSPGEHTDELLASVLGYAAEAIAGLKERGVI